MLRNLKSVNGGMQSYNGIKKDDKEMVRMLSMSLKKFRLKKGFTLKMVGDMVGYAENTVSQWERGICEPNTETLQQLAEIYDSSVSELLGEEEKNLIRFCLFEQSGKTYSVYEEIKQYDSTIPDSVIKEYLVFQKRLISFLEEKNYQWSYSTGRELLFIPVKENEVEIDGLLLEVPEHDFFEREEPWLFISIGNQEEGYRIHRNIDLSIQRLEDVLEELELSLIENKNR